MPNSPTPPPSLMEIMQAVQLMQPAHAVPVVAPIVAEKENSLTRALITGASAIIGIIIIGLLAWMATSVATLNTNMGIVSTNINGIQKSIADLQTSQGSAAQQLSDMRTQNARQDARDDAVEADIKRMKERIRMTEGQKPLIGDTGDL